jgi:triacylglycerol lipase
LMVLPGLGPPSYAYIPQDAQALAATWVTPDGELAVVAIRGTATMDDLLSDLEYSETVGSVADPRVRVHGGMAAVYQAAKPALFAAVPPTAKALFIAGHSLGAAVAFLYAFDAAAAAPGRARPLAVEVHGLAPPRVGNPAFASLLASRARTATLVNLADLVPTLPWSFMPNIQTPAAPDAYAHVPPVAAFEALRSDIVSCHDIFTYYAGISAPPAIVPRPRPSARAPGA